MRNAITILITILLCVCFDSKASDNEYNEILQQFVGTQSLKNMPGASLYISQNGIEQSKSSVGFADIEDNVLITEDSVFPIASITKHFTASAILKLVEQRKLSLNDKLSTYLPNYPTGEHEITVKQMLSHTSGLSDYVREISHFQSVISKSISLDELISETAKFPMVGMPGERMYYSNTGYILLGKIIELVSGLSYGEFLQTNFFTPFNLKDTYYDQSRIINNRVDGYWVTNSEVRHSVKFDTSWGHAAGALYTSSRDLHKWFRALVTGKVINNQSLEQMFSGVLLNDGSVSQYGLGIGITKFGEYKGVIHGGHLYGYRHNIVYIPTEDLVLTILCNFEQCNLSDLTNMVVAHALNLTPPSFKRIDVLPRDVENLLGSYRINDKEIRTFFSIKGDLYTQRTGKEKVQVYAMSKNSFFYPDSLAHFNIEINDQGQMEMLFKRNLFAKKQVAKRL